MIQLSLFILLYTLVALPIEVIVLPTLESFSPYSWHFLYFWPLMALPPLMVGFLRGEVAGMLFAELAIELALALPLGLWLGHEFVAWLVEISATELFSIPPVIAPSSYAIAALIVVAAAMASAWIVRRRIDRLDLVGVLKTRE